MTRRRSPEPAAVDGAFRLGGPVAPRGWVSWALAVLVAAQVALGGWWLASATVLVPVVGETLLLALLALVLVGSRYGRYRRAYERDVARYAVQSERIRLAEDLHDVLGHELSLIALRAGALQLGSSGGTAQQAAELRAQVEHAVLQLRQTVRLLQDADGAPAGLEPLGIDLPALIDRARCAGADITATGCVPAEVSAPARLMVHRVVQEGLTNAAKHAPEASVRVQIGMADGVVDVAVETEGVPRAGRAPGTGLASLRRRLEAIGGDLQVRTPDGQHILHARIPSTTTAAGAPGIDTLPVDTAVTRGITAVRSPGAATARWLLRPALAVAAATVAFYAWATTGATLEDKVFTGLQDGQSVSRAATVLPSRQAPVRLLSSAPAPPGSHCAYYTDGNFPLGMATFEVCDDGARLTRVTDLRKVPFR